MPVPTKVGLKILLRGLMIEVLSSVKREKEPPAGLPVKVTAGASKQIDAGKPLKLTVGNGLTVIVA